MAFQNDPGEDSSGLYVGQEVTVSADVNEVVSNSSFIMAGTDDTDVEPMLVVSATEVSGLGRTWRSR